MKLRRKNIGYSVNCHQRVHILLFGEIFEAQSQFVLLFRWNGCVICDIRKKHKCHFHGTLVHGSSNTSLQDHLQNLGISWLLVRSSRQLGCFLLDVLNSDLNGLEHNLFATDDLDTGLHVWEMIRCGQYCFTLALFMEFTMCFSRLCEWCCKNESLWK